MKVTIFFILVIGFSTVGLILYQHHKFSDGKLHVVFCDVGQGDAVLIRTPKGSAILYDGGPDKKVLACLTEHLPFWDRSIELMLLSHPHADHLIGLLSVLGRYTVSYFDTEKLRNETAMYTSLEEILTKHGTKKRYVLAGDQFTTSDDVQLHVLGPTTKYLEETSPGGTIGEKKEFASVIIHLQYDEFDLLLTGDSQVTGIQDGLGVLGKLERLGKIDVMQVPHHGSATGLDSPLLMSLRPQLAVISVGENSYGHPTSKIIKLLREKDIKIVRTDKNGSIEIISDGKQWWIQ